MTTGDHELACLQGVLELGRAIVSEHDLERLCERVLATCLELTRAERGAIVLTDPSSMAPLVSVTRATSGRPFSIATTVLGLRLDAVEPLLQTEVEPDSTFERAASVRSVMVVPLRSQTQRLGVIAVDVGAVGSPFCRRDLVLLEAIAAVAALGAQNGLLIRQVQSVIGDEWRRLDRVVRDLPLGVVVLDDRGRCVLVNRWVVARSAELGELALGTPVDTIAKIPCVDLIGANLRTTTTTDNDRILSLAANTLTDGRETVIVILDLTEERERQNQAAHRDRVALVGQLAGGVAHDFNNLLHVILTYASLLEDSLTDDEQRDDAHQIAHAATSAADLTRQLLTFSRRELVKPKVVDVARSLQDMDKLLRRTVGPEVDLVITAGQTVPRILIDSAQLEQILLNLVVNARDAMVGPGTIAVSIRGIDVDPLQAACRELPPGRYAAIEVSDSGKGITPEVIGRIFEPYFTTKECGKGTGLGLAIVHGVVHQAGGSVTVESALGLGTTFRILLPATDQPGEQHPAPGPTPANVTILVVDDDDDVRRATERILRSAGYAVLSASSGHNAMAFAREHTGAIDLLLTDVVMPGMSGRDLAREILAIHATERVVFMSGYHQYDPIGATQFISKPFQRVDLLDKIRSALASTPETVC